MARAKWKSQHHRIQNIDTKELFKRKLTIPILKGKDISSLVLFKRTLYDVVKAFSALSLPQIQHMSVVTLSYTYPLLKDTHILHFN